ncbi:hypothetical protein ABIF63_003361 [Bradyrhizobium japonicum]|uniref:Uncharacterized protein n=1 Tax=Bradyrhizobium japonicum TaxID=375 RepID=A0ABV2RQR8_BRAJP|nr:hypothetical protein [Bradyrhizobium japonicum]UQE03254.1 hypothetical protein JEY30_38670 [Bradyrhizobium japonicum]WLB17463.1 hypothetical protein QIH95_36625 [Bradyrhizobium japonicum]
MPRPARRKTSTHADGRPVKITISEMREMGVRGVLIYCHCGHHVALDADRWPEDIRLPMNSAATNSAAPKAAMPRQMRAWTEYGLVWGCSIMASPRRL